MRRREQPERIEHAAPAYGAKARLRALLGDQQGAAMAEAVIMLPALILIWGIILYIHFGFRDAQRNMATLRDHAWSHAVGNCHTTPTAPTEFADEGQFDGESRGGISGLSDALRFVTSTLFQIDEFGARRQRDIERPRSLGGGTRTLEWELLMLCNEQQRDDQDPMWEIWADLGLPAI